MTGLFVVGCNVSERPPAPDDDDDECLLAAPAPVRRYASPLPSRGPGLGAYLPAARPSRPLLPLAPPRATAGDPGDPAVTELRLLVITARGDEPSFLAATGALERIGVPFDVIVAVNQPMDTGALWSTGHDCRYVGVILAESELGYDDGGAWVSAFDGGEWALLDEYELACGARELAWYAWPQESSNGMTFNGEILYGERVPASLTDAGAARFPYLRRDAVIEVAGASGTRALIADGSATTPLLQTEAGDVLAAIHLRPDGREVLSMTFDSSPETRHALLLEAGLIDWVSKGLYLGARRVYLTPQIDDVFMSSELWNAGGASYRMSPADVTLLSGWQAGLAGRLPPGSSLVMQMAFNGAGTVDDTTLAVALYQERDQFEWVNHTWAHIHMDSLSARRAEEAVAANCDLAEEWSLRGFSCSSLVTPEISGLDVIEALQGMGAAGVTIAVSDTSVTEAVNPDNPGTNPSHNVGRANPFYPDIYQVPRRPTNIFFSVSTPQQERDLFNYLYRDEIGRELTYEEIIDLEAEVGLHYLLTYDVDPLMFHQANLRAYGDGTRSLFIDFMDAVIDRYSALSTLPVRTLSLVDIARVMQDRGAYDACGVRALRIADEGGVRLELEASGTCTVPITGLDAPDAGVVELQAGIPTTYVPVDPCEKVTIQLP